MFQEFYIGDKDILHKGEVSCAYYVSNILKQFNLTTAGRANVYKVIEDIKKKGRNQIDTMTDYNNIPLGSILIWEGAYGETYEKAHHHIGFYIGDGKAISNNSIHFTGMQDAGLVPVEHHYTYNNKRALTHIFTRSRDNPFADWLYHYEIDVPFIQGIGDTQLAKEGLSNEEIVFRSGQGEGLQYGKLCGATCVAMVLQYIISQTITLKECISYAHDVIIYFDMKTQTEKTVTCYTPGVGRYHSGLIHIAIQLGVKYNTEIIGSLYTTPAQNIFSLIQQSIKDNINGHKNVIIASVTLEFNTIREKKGGHLVVIIGVDYNGYEYSIIIHDPIENTKKQIPLKQFIESFSGNYILIEKKKEAI